MNNSKIWLVVPPAVGLPVFLGAVAIGSFAVHVAVLSKTNWYSDYLIGAELGSGASAALDPQIESGGTQYSSATVYLDETATDANKQVTVVVLPDGRTAYAVFEKPPVTLAAADEVVPGTARD